MGINDIESLKASYAVQIENNRQLFLLDLAGLYLLTIIRTQVYEGIEWTFDTAFIFLLFSLISSVISNHFYQKELVDFDNELTVYSTRFDILVNIFLAIGFIMAVILFLWLLHLKIINPFAVI